MVVIVVNRVRLRRAGIGGRRLASPGLGELRLVVCDRFHLSHGDRMGSFVVAHQCDPGGRTGGYDPSDLRAVAHQHSGVRPVARRGRLVGAGSQQPGKKKDRQRKSQV